MSSALGTLLVQRLDAVLGTSIASHPHLITGARSTAVTQASATARMQGPEDATRAPPPPGMLGEAETQLDSRLRSRTALPGPLAQRASVAAEANGATAARGSPVAMSQNASAATLLGPTAKLIQALFASNAQAPAFVAGARPLIQSDQVTDSPKIAQQLHRALATSGLFYESHLNSLTFGKFPAAALAQEPQSKWPASALPAENNVAASRQTESGEPARPPEMTAMLRHQLETLASQHIVWRGEAWHDVPLEWSVTRHPREPDDDAQTPGHWQTSLTLSLLTLGQVRVHIQLVDDQVSLHLESETVEPLSAAQQSLRTQLQQAGIHASALSIAPLTDDPTATNLTASAPSTAAAGAQRRTGPSEDSVP